MATGGGRGPHGTLAAAALSPPPMTSQKAEAELKQQSQEDEGRQGRVSPSLPPPRNAGPSEDSSVPERVEWQRWAPLAWEGFCGGGGCVENKSEARLGAPRAACVPGSSTSSPFAAGPDSGSNTGQLVATAADTPS